MKTVRFLFNDEMARAIVEGRKTVTRRPDRNNIRPSTNFPGQWEASDLRDLWWNLSTEQLVTKFGPCAPGDLLIGRESFWQPAMTCCSEDQSGERDYYTKRSRDAAYGLTRPEHPAPPGHVWERRPSIHMPDWAARMRRRVVSVTVERLRDISEVDAQREGIQDGGCETCGESSFPAPCGCANPRPVYADAFAWVWDSIYEAKGLGWAANPYVWRIEFSAENVG